MALRDTSIVTDNRPFVDLIGPAIKAKAKPKKVQIGKIKTLHKLLAVACNDFDAVLRDKRYAVNMGTWHQPYRTTFDFCSGEHIPAGDNRCQVCLAGAVIAKSLGQSPSDEIEFCAIEMDVQARLAALDSLRKGDVVNAVYSLYGGGVSSSKYSKAEDLNEKWRPALFSTYDADNRRDGRRLLAKLRLLQKDLEAAKL